MRTWWPTRGSWGGVGEERRVEERSERGGDGLGGAVGLEGQEGVKDRVGVGCRALRPGLGVGDGRLDEVHDLAREFDSLAHAVFVLQAREGSLDFPGEVEGDAVGGLGSERTPDVHRPAYVLSVKREEPLPPGGEILVYRTEDGGTRIQCRLVDDTIWLTQAQIADLFQKDVRTINEHLANVFDEGELGRQLSGNSG